jgi:plastocyanin
MLRTVLICAFFVAVAPLVRAAELPVQVRDQHGKPLADAVVLATPSDPKVSLHAKPPTDAVDQVDKQFVPIVKVIFVGSKVRFPNSDNIRHQVYSFSPAKKFELPLYAGSAAQPVLFDKPGIIVLGCNIHDWMLGYIYVADTPFFGKTDAQGNVSLADLPPGDYSVRVWHPAMEQAEESTARHVTVTADAATPVEWKVGVRPTYRVPRVTPNFGSFAY